MLYLAVGSLNREAPYFQGARGEGLTIYAFDERTGDARRIAGTDTVDNPTFLCVDAASGIVYANSEVFGWQEGTISVFRFEAAKSALVYLNKQPTQGSITAYNMVTRDGRHVLAANYAMGDDGPNQSLVALPIRPDRSLGPVAGAVRHTGRLGPATDRQERSHPHCIVETVEGGYFLATDLGLDKLFAYSLTTYGHFQAESEVSLPPGSGPRHIAQHPNGRFVYVSNELASTVSLVGREGVSLHLLQTVSTIPDGVASHGADIHISPDGLFVYCSNRGHDSVSIFAVDQTDGMLVLVEHVPSGGTTPRNFTLTPDGAYLLVANQNSDCIVIFARDRETGLLEDTGKRIEIGTPVCIRPFHC